MIVDIDGQRYDLAGVPDDEKAVKAHIHQCIFRGDTKTYRLADGGQVQINWRAVKLVTVNP